jgi:hypothetical protein
MLPEAKKKRHKVYLDANREGKITTAVLAAGDKVVATARYVSTLHYLDANESIRIFVPLFARTSCGTQSNAC